MMRWSHGKFRKRLISKAEELGKQVEVVGEAFTIKTCSRCGWVDQRLGGRKMFRCRAFFQLASREGLENLARSIDPPLDAA